MPRNLSLIATLFLSFNSHANEAIEKVTTCSYYNDSFYRIKCVIHDDSARGTEINLIENNLGDLKMVENSHGEINISGKASQIEIDNLKVYEKYTKNIKEVLHVRNVNFDPRCTAYTPPSSTCSSFNLNLSIDVLNNKLIQLKADTPIYMFTSRKSNNFRGDHRGTYFTNTNSVFLKSWDLTGDSVPATFIFINRPPIKLWHDCGGSRGSSTSCLGIELLSHRRVTALGNGCFPNFNKSTFLGKYYYSGLHNRSPWKHFDVGMEKFRITNFTLVYLKSSESKLSPVELEDSLSDCLQ